MVSYVPEEWYPAVSGDVVNSNRFEISNRLEMSFRLHILQ